MASDRQDQGDQGRQERASPEGGARRQNIKALELVRWIETQPSLAYLRELAGETVAQHDKVTGQLAVKPLDPTEIQKQFRSPFRSLRDLVVPSARSMRGDTYSSPRFEASCRNTGAVMAASTAWDAVSTVPFIQFGLQGFFGFLSQPVAWSISIALMLVSNQLGRLGCNRSKGSVGLANFGLAGFMLLSLIKTSLAGVGFEILINQEGIARRYATVVAQREIQKADNSLNQLLEFKDPKYLQYKTACEAAKRELSGIPREDARFDSLYRRVSGSIAEQDRLRTLGINEKLTLLNNSQIEGECTKQELQLIQNQRSADELRLDLERYRTNPDRLTPTQFLEKEFPSVFSQEFRVDTRDGSVLIREGGTLIGQAFEQFFSRITKPNQISELAISIFWMAISVVLSLLAIIFIWSLSRNKEMIMSHSNALLMTRKNLLAAYQEALPKAQQRRRESKQQSGQ